MRRVLLAIGLAVLAAAVLTACGKREAEVDVEALTTGNIALAQDVNQMRAARRKVAAELNRLRPSGTYLVVDTFRNRVRLMKGDTVVLEDVCSTGTNNSLADTASGREWTFRTPRGRRAVQGSAMEDPVWMRPDWAFIEEGEAPPDNPRERAEAGVLGKYAIPIGDGYFIHGTLYTRLLGYPATHGCVRLGDETLARIVKVARPGTPVIIY